MACHGYLKSSGWGACPLQSTSRALSRPLAAADSDAAPSGTSPSAQTDSQLELETFNVFILHTIKVNMTNMRHRKILKSLRYMLAVPTVLIYSV